MNDETLGLSGASLGPIGIDRPRLVVGGGSARAMAIGARYCDEWNLSTPDPTEFKAGRGRLKAVCVQVGKEPPIPAEAQLWVRDLWQDARSHLRSYEDSGWEAVILVLDEERGPDEVR